MQKDKGPTLLQGAGLHRQIKPRPDLNKMRKVNILIIYYKALGQIHYNYKKRNKNKCAKRIKNRVRGRWTLLKKLNRNRKLIKLNKSENLFFGVFFYIYGILMRKLNGI